MLRTLMTGILVLAVVGAASAQTAPPASPAAATAPVAPAPTVNPYSATVPVAGTSDAQRDAAIGVALGQVLQQLSPGFAATPDVLAKATGYVRDFRYRRAASGNGLELQVDFDQGAIGRLLAATSGSAPAAVAGGSAAAAGTTTSGAAAPPAASAGTDTVWVTGITDSHAFATLLSTLRGDAALHAVTPVAADGDGVLLSVDASQPLTSVLVGLTGPGGHLTMAAQPHPGASASLRWVL